MDCMRLALLGTAITVKTKYLRCTGIAETVWQLQFCHLSLSAVIVAIYHWGISTTSGTKEEIGTKTAKWLGLQKATRGSWGKIGKRFQRVTGQWRVSHGCRIYQYIVELDVPHMPALAAVRQTLIVSNAMLWWLCLDMYVYKCTHSMIYTKPHINHGHSKEYHSLISRTFWWPFLQSACTLPMCHLHSLHNDMQTHTPWNSWYVNTEL